VAPESRQAQTSFAPVHHHPASIIQRDGRSGQPGKGGAGLETPAQGRSLDTFDGPWTLRCCTGSPPLRLTALPCLEHTLLAAFAALVYRYDPTRSEAAVWLSAAAHGGRRHWSRGSAAVPAVTAAARALPTVTGAATAGSTAGAAALAAAAAAVGAAPAQAPLCGLWCSASSAGQAPGEAARARSFGDVLHQSLCQWPRPVHVSMPPTGLPALANRGAEEGYAR